MNPKKRGISLRRPSAETRSVVGPIHSVAPSLDAGSLGEGRTTNACPTPTPAFEYPPGSGGAGEEPIPFPCRPSRRSVPLALPIMVRRPSRPDGSRRRLPHGSGPCVLRTPEDWPLSMRSVAGPNAACRAPLDDTNAEVRITTVSRPVPCGAVLLSLLLYSGETYYAWSRRFPLTLRRIPNRPQSTRP